MNALPMFAAVDLGSNSFRLQICQNNQGQLQVIENMKYMVRFAAGLDAAKYLDASSRERALDCLAQFGERLRGFPEAQVRAVATNTFRVAKNIAEFLPQAEAALGFPIEVIAGREEARLIYTGVAHTYPSRGRKMLVIDIGGGSTEFIIGAGAQPDETESLPLGCVTYSMQFFSGKKLQHRDFQAAVNAARSEIQRIGKRYKQCGWDIAIGTSGSAKSIQQVIEAEGLGRRIGLAAMQTLVKRIVAAGSVKKARFEGLKIERLEVFAGGLAVMIAAFEELAITEMRFTEAALRDGVFYDLIGRSVHEDMRDQTVAQFQERYHVSPKQGERVEKIAVPFFRHLCAGCEADQALEHWTAYLKWAVALHEIGIDIAHTAYHKHTAYILAQADMPGFSRSEQELLSKLTLGQRGDLKKMAEAVGSDEILWHAVLSLRLAVLFCRGRQTVELPENTVLESRGKGYALRISRAWLEANPLTRAALEAESLQWEKIGKTCAIEAA